MAQDLSSVLNQDRGTGATGSVPPAAPAGPTVGNPIVSGADGNGQHRAEIHAGDTHAGDPNALLLGGRQESAAGRGTAGRHPHPNNMNLNNG